MIIYVYKGKLTIKFPVEWEETPFYLKTIPTSRKLPRKTVVVFEPHANVVTALRKLLKRKKLLGATEEAERIMEEVEGKAQEREASIMEAEARFKHGAEIASVPLKSTPYEHQARAFGFCSLLDVSALLMDMGTGKTMVSIALIGHRALVQGVTRILVFCPKAVLPVWKRELQKHADFPYDVHLAGKKWMVPEVRDKPCIWVINYDKASSNKKALKKWNPQFMILDESHKIKNHSARRSVAIHYIAKDCPYRLILSGTVLGQCPLDSFSQYYFLDPNILGHRHREFKEEYAEMGGYKGYQILGYKNLDQLAEKIHSVAFRVTKEECLDLPDKVYQNLYCEASPASRALYRELEEEMRVEIGEDDEIEVDRAVSLMMKLRQITGGIVRSSTNELHKVATEKVSVLKDFIEARDEDAKKMVIFVSFTQEMTVIGELLDSMGIGYLTLHGGTSDEERNTLEDTFKNDSRYDIVLIQISTGAEGLDFVAADTCIFYSPSFSFIHYWQACARIHRIGQDRTCLYVNLVMKDSVDEKIVEFLEKHEKMSQDLLENMRNYTVSGDKNGNRQKTRSQKGSKKIRPKRKHKPVKNPH